MPSALLILSSASACITASPPSIPIDSTNLTNINSTKSGIYLTCVLFIRKARRTPECRYAKSFLLCKNHESTSLFRFTNSTSPHRRPPRNPVTQMRKFRAHKNQNTFCTMYIPRRKRLYEFTLRRFKQYDKRAERIRFVAAPDGLFRACFGLALAGASGLRPPMECAQVNRPCKHTPVSLRRVLFAWGRFAKRDGNDDGWKGSASEEDQMLRAGTTNLWRAISISSGHSPHVMSMRVSLC